MRGKGTINKLIQIQLFFQVAHKDRHINKQIFTLKTRPDKKQSTDEINS